MDKQWLRRAIVALLPLCSGAVLAEVYRWTDADGHVHFSDQAPQRANGEVREIKVPDSPVQPDPELQRERERGQKLLEVWSAEKRAREDSEQESAAGVAQHEQSCAQLRAHLEELRGARLVIRTEATGERRPLDVDERVGYEKELHELLAAHCS